MVDANNVFIVSDNDVVVVDANGAPGITREVVAALRKITNKPVRYRSCPATVQYFTMTRI